MRSSAALGILGPVAAPFALQLAAVTGAGAASAPDYKALVCLFQYGGNDSNNMILATDNDTFGRYFAARNTGSDPIALMPPGTPAVAIGNVSSVTGRTVASRANPEFWGGVLPFVPKTANPVPAGTNASARTFAMHPALAPLMPHFQQSRLAVMANVGTLIQPLTKAQYTSKSASIPKSLFSHNDQQSTWQSGGIEGTVTGWGGKFGDLLVGQNGNESIFTAISTSGNAVFLAGEHVVQYQVSTNALPAVAINGLAVTSLNGASGGPAALKAIIGDTTGVSNFASDYATVVNRSLGATSALNGAMGAAAAAVPALPTYINPITNAAESNAYAIQLQTVARIIAAAPGLGVKRQVFFVSMGNHDSHDIQNQLQPNNLAKLAQALSWFDGALSNMGGVDMRPAVTSFTASDFNRTFTTNGDGTDHAWGGHHLVMGGSVRGGDMYGQFPTLGIDATNFNNPNMVGTAIIPTTSVDQYAATLGSWLGASATDLATIFPNLQNYTSKNVGFV
jgi:uncharacterized protein (DUF1501 family)